MPEKSKTYRARIEGYTSEGLGVARIDGQAVFVHRALRGEDCDVLILKALKNAAFAHLAHFQHIVLRASRILQSRLVLAEHFFGFQKHKSCHKYARQKHGQQSHNNGNPEMLAV